MKTNRELITHVDPKAPVSEAFRTLRTNIQFMSTTRKLKTILVTSTSPREGKSWTASNLAVTFAQAGNSVILIDADMRKGRLHQIFGVPPVPGLSNYLYGVALEGKQKRFLSQFTQKTEIENLVLMPAGNVPPNPSELLVSDQMKNLLKDVREKYDIVIIDGTPCELVTDSIILSTIVDATIIVASYKETRKENLNRIIKNIKNVKGHLLGVVLNKVPVSKKKYSERYYYDSGSFYGKKEDSPATDDEILLSEIDDFVEKSKKDL